LHPFVFDFAAAFLAVFFASLAASSPVLEELLAAPSDSAVAFLAEVPLCALLPRREVDYSCSAELMTVKSFWLTTPTVLSRGPLVAIKLLARQFSETLDRCNLKMNEWYLGGLFWIRCWKVDVMDILNRY